MASGLGYPFETLLQLFETVPTIRAIKDWSNDAMLHERHIRTFQNLPKPVNVLTTHSSWLMASLTMGANGLLSGAGSVIADLQVALFQGGEGRRPHEGAGDQRSHLSARAGLLRPALPRHAQPHEGGAGAARPADKAVVRPPLMKLCAAEIGRIRRRSIRRASRAKVR